jgi:endonuclease/exonuclease/phosphatase family metal-dependent hydrolase
MNQAITILSLNLHKGFGQFSGRLVLHELREAIRMVGADLVFLQEVVGEHQRHARRHAHWPDEPQYEFLADTVWNSHAYGRNAVYPDGHHGNAVLSRFPIRRFDNHDVSERGHERRGLLHCEIELPWIDVPLHAVCVHLGLREAHRRRQLQAVSRLVRTHTHAHQPLVVAGDFNDWRQRAHALLQTTSGLSEAFVEHCGRAARTFPAIWPLLRLDRVYLRNLRAQHAQPLTQRPWSRLSDHAGLLCELQPC